MSWRIPFLLVSALLVACHKDTPCETLCHTLVMTCDYAAYPTVDSCIEGCLYDEDQGADIEGEMECIEETSCDPIGTVECARKFNPGG